MGVGRWEGALRDEGSTEPGEGPGERWPGSAVLWARQVLMEWINAELLPEHIVVRSLEEDMFDGLILHHLYRKWLPPPHLPYRWAPHPSLPSHPVECC